MYMEAYLSQQLISICYTPIYTPNMYLGGID